MIFLNFFNNLTAYLKDSCGIEAVMQDFINLSYKQTKLCYNINIIHGTTCQRTGNNK